MVQQRPGHAADLPTQLAITQLALATPLVPEYDRRAVVAVAQQVFGEVQPGTGKPVRTEQGIGRRHAVQTHDDLIPRLSAGTFLRNDSAKPPDLGPERLGM